MTTVVIAKASDYDCTQIYNSLKRGLQFIGGLESIVSPGSKVFVKVNHLSPASPADSGIVTHPVFIEAVLRLLLEAGANITVGDDIDMDVRDGFKVSGLWQICDRVGIRLVNLRDNGFVEVKCNGHFLKKIYLSRTALEADIIINLPKLKTHSTMVLTGGVKNMYGVIPRGLRKEFHGKYYRNEDFAQVIVDIFSAIKPHLTIMDAIVAMEGEGPGSGKLKKLGVILVSQDAVAVDAVAAKIIGIKPMDIRTTQYCNERGLGVGNLDRIEIAGESLESVISANFKIPISGIRLPAPLFRLLWNQLDIKPQVIERECQGCFECVKSCPTGAISVASNMVKVNQAICVKCLCCHEVCRFGAIIPKRSAIGNTIQFIADVLKGRK